MFGKRLTENKIKKIHDAAINAPFGDEVLKILSPLIEVQGSNDVAADALIDVVQNQCLTIDQSLALLSDIYDAHNDNDDIIILIGSSMEACRNLDYLNDPPPEHPLFEEIITSLSKMAESCNDTEKESLIIEALSGATRLAARRYDELAQKSYARLVELLPDTSWAHYNQGLFFKTRGYFSESVIANQRSIELADEACDGNLWNLGISATGSGQGEIALDVWKGLGQKIELGRYDLPEGGYPSCKIRLAERPLSERDTEHDDPGLEETVWIERLSPCHGIIRSVLYQDLGVDYGDVILFDGAPVTYHKYGDKEIAVFPHLATIKKNNYKFFDFAGTQSSNGELGGISEYLDSDAVIYSHTERFKFLCSGCWNDESVDHEHGETEENNVVIGRIAIPPGVEPIDTIKKIDSALKGSPGSRIFSPDLCYAAGMRDRARIEERRFNLLSEATE